MNKNITTRRRFILAGGTMAVTALIPAMAAGTLEEGEEEVSPAEDLMREHGVLNRVLLIYEEIGSRIAKGKDFPPEALTSSRTIIRTFIEDYHERLEEQYLFPRFEKAKKQLDLVAVLRQQHKTGRQLTDLIASSSKAGKPKEVANYLHLFIHMYRPHESREDTVLFPAFRAIVSGSEYKELGEHFEEKEHELFGKTGFEDTVKNISLIEKQLGIADLASFTPKI